MTLEEIAKNHGLTPEGVNYALTQYQIVISEITHGMMSKLSYDANDVIRVAQERWCDTCELKEQESVEPKWASGYEGGVDALCGSCMTWLADRLWNYCPHCGKKIKWGTDRCYNAY